MNCLELLLFICHFNFGASILPLAAHNCKEWINLSSGFFSDAYVVITYYNLFIKKKKNYILQFIEEFHVVNQNELYLKFSGPLTF